jgi:hypothetical protein
MMHVLFSDGLLTKGLAPARNMGGGTPPLANRMH